MTKKILTIISVILCLALIFAFVGCTNSTFGPVTGGPSADAEVVSNGGMAVQKGDYIYFINGVEAKSASNDFPNVKKGAIYRVKSDLSEDAVCVVPKIVTADNKDAGFYIFGDYIYYTSPSTEKDRTGAPKFNNIAFCRTKLDGTKTEVLITLTSFAVQYSFYEAEDGTVYLTYFEDATLSVFNTSTKKSAIKVGNITNSVLMKADGVFFTQSVGLDKENNEVEYDKANINITKADYNKIFKLDFNNINDSTKAKIEYISGADDNASYQIAAYKDGIVYAYKKINVEELKGLFAVASDGTETQITANDFYGDIYPISVSEGIIAKDTKTNKIVWVKDYDAEAEIPTSTVITILQGVSVVNVIDNNIFYLSKKDGKNSLMKIDYTAENIEEITGSVVCDWDVNTSFLKPEFIGDKFFFINNEHKESVLNEGTDEEEIVFDKYEDYMYVANINAENVSDATLIGFVIDKDQPDNED